MPDVSIRTLTLPVMLNDDVTERFRPEEKKGKRKKSLRPAQEYRIISNHQNPICLNFDDMCSNPHAIGDAKQCCVSHILTDREHMTTVRATHDLEPARSG